MRTKVDARARRRSQLTKVGGTPGRLTKVDVVPPRLTKVGGGSAAVPGRRSSNPPIPARAASRAAGDRRVCLGSVSGWDESGPLVTIDGHHPVRVRPCAGIARCAVGSEVVLLVSPGGAPVLLGVLQPLGGTLEARLDGRRVELDARDEIVLRCGEASITLRRNGRVVIRGIQVETRGSRVNRIKGGSVAIN
jgi:hypothetical protein